MVIVVFLISFNNDIQASQDSIGQIANLKNHFLDEHFSNIPSLYQEYSSGDLELIHKAREKMPPILKECTTEENVFNVISAYEKEKKEVLLSHVPYFQRKEMRDKIEAIEFQMMKNNSAGNTVSTDTIKALLDDRVLRYDNKIMTKEEVEVMQCRIKGSLVYKKIVKPIAAHYKFKEEDIVLQFDEPAIAINFNGSENMMRYILIKIPENEIRKTDLSYNQAAEQSSIYVHEIGGHGVAFDDAFTGRVKALKGLKCYYENNDQFYDDFHQWERASEQMADINGILNPAIEKCKKRQFTDEERAFLYLGRQIGILNTLQDKKADHMTCNPEIEDNWNWSVSLGRWDRHPPEPQRLMVVTRLLDILKKKNYLTWQAK